MCTPAFHRKVVCTVALHEVRSVTMGLLLYSCYLCRIPATGFMKRCVKQDMCVQNKGVYVL